MNDFTKTRGMGAVIQTWLDSKLALIATRLPESVKEPASFRCGHDMGYKQALLDLDRLLEEPIDE